jgi:hypothetical protein
VSSGNPTWVTYTVEDMPSFMKAMSSGVGVLNSFGTMAASQHSDEARVTWVPKAIAPGGPGYDVEDAEGLGGFACEFDVGIVAHDFGRLLHIVKSVATWVDMFCGPPGGDPDAGAGYAIGKSSVPKGDLPGAASWGVTIPVTINDLNRRRTFPVRAIESTTMIVEVTDQNFENEETVAELDVPAVVP